MGFPPLPPLLVRKLNGEGRPLQRMCYHLRSVEAERVPDFVWMLEKVLVQLCWVYHFNIVESKQNMKSGLYFSPFNIHPRPDKILSWHCVFVSWDHLKKKKLPTQTNKNQPTLVFIKFPNAEVIHNGIHYGLKSVYLLSPTHLSPPTPTWSLSYLFLLPFFAFQPEEWTLYWKFLARCEVFRLTLAKIAKIKKNTSWQKTLQ